MSFLRLQAVSRRFGRVTALDAVDLAVPEGSRTAILGPSGSGKSTLLRIIGGFEAPDSGRITLGGDLLAEGPRTVPAHLRGIGLVAQEGVLFPHLNVADNIGFGLPRATPGREARIAALLAMVELDPSMLLRRPDQLSGGQQQRVALARALARKPRLMLLDEPFSALDTGLRASTRKAVGDLLAAEGVTTILVTHDQAEALSFADQVVLLREGRLLQAGKPRDLYLQPRDATVATFFGEAVILPARLSGSWAECALGRVPLTRSDPRGRAEIMLRPEQIALLPAGTQAPEVRARVETVEFGGASCGVTVRLQEADENGHAPRLELRCSCLTAPPVGSLVRLAVSGQAHPLLPTGERKS
ncbi:ABC transporter ATP-binding protein [Roseomonas sp. E05]|uniref:ABC transporter ATP-binding protein n=1 Tax=Roseomonas sp. E05 TaxID=3046310 RepID=UPI0024B94506|nr:ABC transporter ATP-binding protein [Roseomonas sp. E05]MDJ0390286.1 ABC transporter ATP-binding protein [Roseomonas sp. E05]